MIEGTLIAESLRVGTDLEGLELTVRKISRYQAQGTTPDQPGIWTVLDFEAEPEAEKLAQAFADSLDQPGWYANFQSPAESFVIFPGRVFRYPRGDETGRAEAQAYGAPARHPGAAAGLDGVTRNPDAVGKAARAELCQACKMSPKATGPTRHAVASPSVSMPLPGWTPHGLISSPRPVTCISP